MAPLPPPTKRTHAIPPSSKTPHKPTNKREKRISKHANLLSRITKSAPKPSHVTKRRRPSKKLVTNLASLADALPRSTAEAAADDNDDEAWEGIASGDDSGGKIKHQSLKSKPGARKKKEKLAAMERERFARNLAEMAAGSSSSSSSFSSSQNATADGRMIIDGGREGDGTRGGSADRWAAIRGFIRQTMERRPGGGAGVGGNK
ncbi:MAG: hypothetical protein Q9161_001906 [Pseudevernia consocians]